MALSDFLSHSYRYYSHAGVTNVSSIRTDLLAELVTNPAAADKWTDVGGAGTGPFKCPVASDGSFIQIAITLTSATRITYAVTDHLGMAISTLQQDIDAGGTEIRYFTGPDYCMVDSIRATPECWWVARMNQWPHSIGNTRYSFATSKGPRSGGSATGTAADAVGLPLGGTAYTAVSFSLHGAYDVTTAFVSLTGVYQFSSAELGDNLGSSTVVSSNLGTMPQALIITSLAAFGAEYTVPIDVDTTGVFKVCGLPASSSAGAGRRLAMRKA